MAAAAIQLGLCGENGVVCAMVGNRVMEVLLGYMCLCVVDPAWVCGDCMGWKELLLEIRRVTRPMASVCCFAWSWRKSEKAVGIEPSSRI